MLKIAITGNIASGKTLFEKCLETFGFKVLCLDNVTNFLYENNEKFKEFLLKKFNTISKRNVAEIVFSDLSLKTELENFIYPLILSKMQEFFIENKNNDFLFVSAAMLYETGFDKYFDKVVFIDTDENTRLKRLVVRNNISVNDAMKRIKAQMPAELKINRADYVIDNSGSVEDLKNKAKAFVEKLLEEH